MGGVLRYFRLHPWQRRIVTCSGAALLGVLAACLAWPTIQELRALDALGPPDPPQRQRAIARAVALARSRPGFVARLEGRLDSADDLAFSDMIEVLSRLGLDKCRRRGDQLDRYWALSLQSAQSPAVRLILLHDLILSVRDNVHVRRGLALAAGDAEAQVRSASAVLAARVGDDQALLRLLSDAEPSVRASAALDAALADRRACQPAVSALLPRAKSDEEVACAAYALWKWSAGGDVPSMAKRADADDKPILRDLLLHVLATPAPSPADQAAAKASVLDILAHAPRQQRMPSAMTFVAAGRLGMGEAAPFVRQTIDAALARRNALTTGDLEGLAAAVGAARRLGLPDGRRMMKVLAGLWHERTSLVMILAAEALGDMLTAPIPPTASAPRGGPATQPDDAEQRIALEILRQGVEYSKTPTPVPSAAAAVAMFRIAPDSSDDAIQWACQSDVLLAGDYVAWELHDLARPSSGGWAQYAPAAQRVANLLLDAPGYDVGERSAGAMVLALLDRGTARAPAAVTEIRPRLAAQAGPNRNILLYGSYQCALLILGRSECAGDVVALSESEDFSRSRAATALVLAGNPAGLDCIFASPTFNPPWIDSFLGRRLMARVLAEAAPVLPTFDLDAPTPVRYWQCRILRDDYLINRAKIVEWLGQ